MFALVLSCHVEWCRQLANNPEDDDADHVVRGLVVSSRPNVSGVWWGGCNLIAAASTRHVLDLAVRMTRTAMQDALDPINGVH